MKIVGLMLVFGGWLISVIGLNIASSNAGRLIMCLIGIAPALLLRSKGLSRSSPAPAALD